MIFNLTNILSLLVLSTLFIPLTYAKIFFNDSITIMKW